MKSDKNFIEAAGSAVSVLLDYVYMGGILSLNRFHRTLSFNDRTLFRNTCNQRIDKNNVSDDF
jgi:hypothetical protein